MATSGSINLTATGLDIIKEAYEQIGVIGPNDTPSTDLQASALRTLNYVMKAWQGEGTNLFAIQKITMFLAKAQHAYALHSAGDNVTASFVKTTINGAAASGASSITVTDDTGMSDADYIGIELSDGTLQWTTINGAPASNVVTLTAALTGAVSDAAAVFTYTTKANRPMKILHAVRTDFSENDTPLNLYPLDMYADLSNKTNDGTVVTLYYDPQVGANASLYVWPESSSVRDRITLWVQRTIEDIDATTEDVDYPQEWFLALALNLAVLLAPKYGLSRADINALGAMAIYYKDVAEGYDREDELSIIPGDM